MMRILSSVLFIAMFGFTMATQTYAAPDQPVSGAQSIKGDVLKIEGEFYTVQDMAGHDVRVHVDKTTKLDGVIKTGDKVEVQVTDKGHAFSMTHSHVADTAVATGPQAVNGDLLKIDGTFYVLQDMSGKEVRVHVDETTKQDGVFKTGDNVEAQMTNKSHAISMKHGNPAK